MNDDLAFCLQTFVDKQRIALESTRIEQENLYHVVTSENKNTDDKRHQLQDKLIVLAQRVFSWLQVAVNICYEKIQKEINNIFLLSAQNFNTDHVDHLVMLLVTIHSEFNLSGISQWLPSYFTPILRESIVMVIQCQNVSVGTSNKNMHQSK
jgi:hypothetical protein